MFKNLFTKRNMLALVLGCVAYAVVGWLMNGAGQLIAKDFVKDALKGLPILVIVIWAMQNKR